MRELSTDFATLSGKAKTGSERVGKGGCADGHSFAVTRVGAGLARHECRRCEEVVIDLDAAEDEAVTAPGLFRPKRPTIFSVLAEERRRGQHEAEDRSVLTRPRYAFGAGVRRR